MVQFFLDNNSKQMYALKYNDLVNINVHLSVNTN